MSNVREARISVAIAAIQEWQRGAITWVEAMRRADLDAAEEAALEGVQRTISEADLRRRLETKKRYPW